MAMRQHQFGNESDKTFWAQNRGTTRRDLSSRASSATLRLAQQQPYSHLEGRGERADVSIAQGLLREEALNHPQKLSPFSSLLDSRSLLTGADGQCDFLQNALEQDRRKNRNTSNTWTDSSLGTAPEDEDDRTEFVKEYNRLAEKHGVRNLIPEGYEGLDIDTVTITSKQGSWLMRKILRRTSSSHTLNIRSDKQIRHKRSVSDFSTRLKLKRHTLKDKTLGELVDLCGRSLLYLPSDYAASSLGLPTCLRATAHHIVQHGITTRGIFRIPGSSSSALTLYHYYATIDEHSDEICGTVRSPTLPKHLQYDIHDVASVFKKFLSGLPGGILQGSINLFEALIGIQSYLNSDPEWTRTKQSKVRARLIALAIGCVRSRLQRELMCAVFGLLCMIGRAAELAPREDDRGRPLPTSGLMGYGALGIIFGPLLLGETLDTYDMRFAHGGVIVFPVAPSAIRKDSNKMVSYKRKSVDDLSYSASKFDKVKVANSITEMIITHWRDVVRHMRALCVLKTNIASGSGGRIGGHLRPYASEVFSLKKPPEWGTEDQSIRQVNQTPSPTPLQRHISQSEAGPANQPNEYLRLHKNRTRPLPPAGPVLSGSKSMGTLSPMAEEPSSEDRNEKMPFKNAFTQELRASGGPPRNPVTSNPALVEAAKQLKSPKERSDQQSAATSGLLAEVAQSLQEDAQKLMGINMSNYPRTKTPMAELSSLSKEEEQALGQPETADGSRDLATKEPVKEAAAQIPPDLEISIRDAAGDNVLRSNSLVENVRQESKQAASPRSKARVLFQEATRNLALTSSPRSDHLKVGSSGGKLMSPHRLPWHKSKESIVVSPGEVETSLVQPSIGASISLRGAAREFFERADRERASAIGGTGDQGPSVPVSPQKTDSEAIKLPSAEEPAAYASKPVSPSKSDAQRSSTSTKSIVQPGPNGVQMDDATDLANPPRNSVSTHKEKFNPAQSPHRRAFLKFETSKHPKEPENVEEVRHSPKDSGIPQGLVNQRIRGLAASDPGNQILEDTELKAVSDVVKPLANTTAKRKSKSDSTISSVRNAFDRTSHEKDQNPFSDLTSAVKFENGDVRPFRTAHPDQRPSRVSPPPGHHTPTRAGRGSLKRVEEDSPKQLAQVEEKDPEEVDYFGRNQFAPRSKATSQNQKSDASNDTVILAPRNQFQAIDEPISGHQRFFRRTNNSTMKTMGSGSNNPVSSMVENPGKSSDATDNAVATSPIRIARQQTEFKIPQFNGAKIVPNSKDPQSLSPTQTPENQSPSKGLKSGSVMALAARFNHVEQPAPASSPVKRARPQSIARNLTFQRANNFISNYTTNPQSPSSPSPVKSIHSERSEFRAVRNPAAADRRPEGLIHKTPQKEISPMYRTPRSGGAPDTGSPSPFSANKPRSSPVPSKMRGAVDGNDSQTSPAPYHRLADNSSPFPRTPDHPRESPGPRPPSRIGTILPHPIEPPVDGHIAFARPPSTPRRLPASSSDSLLTPRITTPTGHAAALYDQIRKLQRQLAAARDELAHHAKQLQERDDLADLGTLTEALRESRRECQGWRARAQAAERRLALLQGFPATLAAAAADPRRADDGDGASDTADDVDAVARHSADASERAGSEASASATDVTAIVRSYSGAGEGGELTLRVRERDRATGSTDTAIWIKGGTATFLRAAATDRGSGASGSTATERAVGGGGGESTLGGTTRVLRAGRELSWGGGQGIVVRKNRGGGGSRGDRGGEEGRG